MSGPERGGSWWRRIWPPSVQDSQTSQKSCEDEPGFSSSLNFLEEEDPGPLSQQLPATSSRGSEPLSNLDLSRGSLVNVEYLPFFRTYGQLLVEEVALQPDVGRDQEGVWSTREAPSQEDSEPPGGFSPYYRSKEESFLSLSWGRSQGPPTRREAQAGCSCRRTGSSGSSAASAGPDLISWVLPNRCPVLMASAGHPCDSGLDAPLSSDAAIGGHVPHASGFVPYYRTPEEGLHTSPGPPASPSGARSPQGSCPDLVQPYCEEAEGGNSKSHQGTGPQHPLVTEGGGGWAKGPRAQLALGPELQALSPSPQCPQPAEPAGGAQSLAGCPSPAQDTELAWRGDPVHC
ncbi:hypothetical protein HJG60_008728 [Phyllostomus discolor]|uniref:Uncharacterized protein n=1 Tax=Phyllostomus discolor TaxID=89673 RepID=A0A833YWB3_9CHIR|nr:hypothetical protein HJG60_008728 [Phyllostomus discolor]